MANEILKTKMKQSGVKQWQVADLLGVSESTLCVWMRHELKEETRQQIEEAIQELSN